MATEGGHKEGEEVAHKLQGWTEDCVTMLDSARTVHHFRYPARVLVPETTQRDMYECMLPSLVDAWINSRNNVMVLAYGQTGTGKTHTMFGPRESLMAREEHPDWGVFPRVFSQCLQAIEASRGRASFLLTGSAVEFYCGLCCDLLNDHVPLEVDGSGAALMVHMRVMESMADFYAFLEDVKANRVTRATRMNTESSRSHCALLLCLFQLDHESRTFWMTKFNLIDLAGSERAEKTGERASGTDAMTEVYQVMMGKKDATKLGVGIQAFFINWELMHLAGEVRRATDMYKLGKKYNPPRSGGTPFQRYTGEIMTGHTLLTTCICISPAPQNGSENLFSLKWGQNMASLRAPTHAEKPQPIETAYKKACETADKAAAELKSRDESNKYYNSYLARSQSSAQRKAFLERLMAMAA